ncbi:MAG: hypothetical protein JHD16_03415 [Solirubrobacteraceae bacterium]|nr:hypothetical protein [Solirubrobacteraceae bacterium]
MSAEAFVPVLGHPRVITAAADAERRVLAHDGDRIVGVAAFEPIGSTGEAIITLAPDASGGLVQFLLDELASRAARLGVFSLRFDFGVDDQRGIADRLASRRSDCSVRRDHLDVRTTVQQAHQVRRAPAYAAH